MTPTTYKYKTRKRWLELRAEDVTSTEVAALFGLSPYTTKFELWHIKKNKMLVDVAENDRMIFGDLLEPVIAKENAKREGWEVNPRKIYQRLKDIKLGSSFDFEVYNGKRIGINEIKNVDSLKYKQQWIDGEAPPHIELQAQTQLMVSQRPYLMITAFVGGNDLKNIERELDPKIKQMVEDEVRKFWESIEKNEEPKPDFKRDFNFIRNYLYGNCSPNKVMDLTDNERVAELIAKHKEASKIKKSCDTQLEEIKAEILFLIGDAEKAYGKGFSVSAGNVAPTRVSYERKGYRNFRINHTKIKGEQANESSSG